MKRQKRHIPATPINPNDLWAIDNILRGYIIYIQNNSSLSPSAKITQKMRNLEHIQEKVSFVLRGGEGVTVTVTKGDFQALREAMVAFVQIIRQTVPQTPERDETLRRVNLLRKRLEQYFFSSKK